MKRVLSVLALGASLSLAPAAFAQDADPDCPPCEACPGPVAAEDRAGSTLLPIDGDEEQDAEIAEIEAQLNVILLVDESGRISLREEFKESLPFPPQRIEMMLGSLVELGDDGKIHLKNPEVIRPYLPMIRGFLKGGGMDRMKEVQKLPPAERREAMRRMFGEGGTPFPFGGRQRPERAKPQPQPERAKPADEPQRERRERRARRARDGQGQGQGARGEIMARLERIERSQRRIEEMLRGMLERHPEVDGDRPRSRRDRRDRRTRRRARRGERERGGLFRRFFRRGGEGRSGARLEDMMRRGRVWSQGLAKLRDIMEPEDMDVLRETIGGLLEDFDPQDMENPGEMLGKVQKNLQPEDMARMMEVFSEFIATPEGRAMVAELEQMAEDLEGFVSSPEGQRLNEMMQRLQERMGNGQGEGGLGRLRELIRPDRPEPRQPQRESRNHREERRSSARARHERERREAPSTRPPGAKLY